MEKECIVYKTVKLVSVDKEGVEKLIPDLMMPGAEPVVEVFQKTGEVHVRVTAAGADEDECNRMIKPVVFELKKRFDNRIYTTDEDVTFEKALVDLLKSCDLKVMTVESCTGGMVASRIVDVPGASEVFKCGLITYSNKAKRKLAGVNKLTLDAYGAVSAETAKEMVKEPKVWKKADVVIGVTGYASPVDNPEKNGLVFVSCNVCGKIIVEKHKFEGDRREVREAACMAALVLCRRCVMDYFRDDK